MPIILLVFLSAAVVQVIYFVLFLIALGKKHQLPSGKKPLPVSVVVCAHDEEANLRELVPLLLQQEYPEFEVIIIDDRSNDNTFDWLLAETQKDHRLKMVHVNRTPPHTNEKKYAITLGIRSARFDRILLTDADCRPVSPRWIQNMSEGFTDQTKFVIGFSPYSKAPGLLNSFIRFESLITGVQYISFALLGYPYMGVGRNLAYRKTFFMDQKGFHDYLSVTGGDDDLFVNRHAKGVNTVVKLGPDSLVQSIPKKSWRSFFHQKVRHLSVGKLYRFPHRFLLGIFSASWLLFWFTMPLLFFFPDQVSIALAALFIRPLVLMMVVKRFSKTSGQPFEAWMVPLLDFIYAFYYLVTGLVAIRSKKVRWKKN